MENLGRKVGEYCLGLRLQDLWVDEEIKKQLHDQEKSWILSFSRWRLLSIKLY